LLRREVCIMTDMIGLKRNTVKLLDWSPSWTEFYENEKNTILTKIKTEIIDIQHVGSTSIPGIKSKPIIDIAIGIEKFEGGIKLIKPIEDLGYEYRGNAGVEARCFFAKGPENCRYVYLHLEEFEGSIWRSHIVFRDILRKDEAIRLEYQNLKEKLAKEFPNDRDTYCKIKGEWIERILKENE